MTSTLNQKEITSRIKRGDYTKLSAKTGFERSYVWRVVNGERSNTTILKEASKLVSRRK